MYFDRVFTPFLSTFGSFFFLFLDFFPVSSLGSLVLFPFFEGQVPVFFITFLIFFLLVASGPGVMLPFTNSFSYVFGVTSRHQLDSGQPPTACHLRLSLTPLSCSFGTVQVLF